MDKEELVQRIKSAIILLTEGHLLKVGELTFCNKEKHIFSVAGCSVTYNLETLTIQKALTELKEIKILFNKMVNASYELSEYIKNKQIQYYLYFDYGMGYLGICNEIEGRIKWETELKE